MEKGQYSTDKIPLKIINLLNPIDGSTFHIKWRLHRICNYSCSYCIQKNCRDFGKNTISEAFEAAFKAADDVNVLIKNLPERVKTVRLNMIGGEPTLYDLCPILEKLEDRRVKELNLTTNLAQSLEYWEKLVNYCNSRGILLQVSASYHEMQTPKSFVDKAMKIVDMGLGLENMQIKSVKVGDNEDIMNILERLCIKNNLYYNLELDARTPEVMKKGVKPSYNKQVTHYEVTEYDCKTKQTSTLKLHYLTDIRMRYSNVNHFLTPGRCVCTVNYNFITIDTNPNTNDLSYVLYILHNDNDAGCYRSEVTKIRDFKAPDKPLHCNNSNSCWFCGTMSIWRENNE